MAFAHLDGHSQDMMDSDLYNVVTELRHIPEATKRRWVAQVVWPHLSPSFASDLIHKLLQALGIDALHNMGIIHRDLKMENILVSKGPDLEVLSGNVRIADFDNAWMAPGDDIPDHLEALSQGIKRGQPLDWRRTYACKVVGTPDYMAPEVISGQSYGIMVDWWALGHIAWEIVNKQVRLLSMLSSKVIFMFLSLSRPCFRTNEHLCSSSNGKQTLLPVESHIFGIVGSYSSIPTKQTS